MIEVQESAQALLDEAYVGLGYVHGSLLKAERAPHLTSHAPEEWLEKGDWLALAHRTGAERVFFVNNDPVIVFHKFIVQPDTSRLLAVFHRTWSMARPPCLFIAQPGELSVYSLNQSPPRHAEDWHPLAIATRVADVAEKLRDYSREQVESGQAFAQGRFGALEYRADKRLIRDLKEVRRALMDGCDTTLEPRYAHALIGRSIFIRYLEDRSVLTSAYFEAVARDNKEWEALLVAETELLDLTPGLKDRLYDRVLRSKPFTYALFKKLAHDFNGDMFPMDEDEEKSVSIDHLKMLRRFLLGDIAPRQASLFFWAYDFSVVPTELISNIYEEFYHTSSTGDDKSTYYTPLALVDYVLSQILTQLRLDMEPRILDTSCGSGVFLAEAFRRIVRHKMQQAGRSLTPIELRHIIRDQLKGIEINTEAAQISAFSLYLALLDYQEPPDILANPELPKLIHNNTATPDETHYQCIINGNAFSLMRAEQRLLRTALAGSGPFNGRTRMRKLCTSSDILPLEPHSIDIIVGNPPWGFDAGASPEIKAAQQQAQDWWQAFDWSVGDKEFAQAFIARTMSLLKPGGQAGLLVSTGVFFKDHVNSMQFRRRWVGESTIHTVVNFAHVRRFFFSANAPFAFVRYEATIPEPNHQIMYWSVKKTLAGRNRQAVVLNRADLRWIRQGDVQADHQLWKVLWWGNHRDAALVSTLKLHPTLGYLSAEREWLPPGRGFQAPLNHAKNVASGWLKSYHCLPTERFTRYGPITGESFTSVPDMVQRRGERDIYDGWRLLIKRGISQENGGNGQITARLEDISYAVRNSIHGVPMGKAEDWERKVLTGIVWSSLAKYYFFMTSSSWGLWHDELHLEDIIGIPICFPRSSRLRNRIVDTVDRLREMDMSTESLSLFNEPRIGHQRATLEQRLNDAIFDLYELNEDERDLVSDLCTEGLRYFYASHGPEGMNLTPLPKPWQGRSSDIPSTPDGRAGLFGYIHAFLQIWNRELEPSGEFFWRIIWPTGRPMVAVVFTTISKNEPLPRPTGTQEEAWHYALSRCAETLRLPVSRNVYIDGMVRAVTDTDIFIIRRNERRLWTRSTGREDAEATLLQAIYLQDGALRVREQGQ